MEFASPDRLWWLLAVPVVAGLAAFCWRRRLAAARDWAARGLWDRLLPSYSRHHLTATVVLLTIALAAVILTWAQPRWGTSEQQVERRGVDIVFVLDTSLSMATRDLQPNRLWVAQTLIRRLVQDLPGHRVALVQAEGDGVVMVPLTADGAVLDLLLDAVQPGSLPTPGTELTPSLERAVKLFPEGEDKHRILILLSDGEDHGKGLDKLAGSLKEEGVIAHTIGVGTLAGMPLELPQLEAGQALEYKKDEQGQVVVSHLMEDTLETLSRTTGGIYLRASSAALGLEPLVQRIESMEKQSYGSEVVNLLEERFQWPLALAILALGLHLAIGPFRDSEAL